MSQYRSAGALGCHTRIRAGFPREFLVDRSMARDRPSPYGEGGRFSTKNPPVTVARGPVPRERWNARTMARDRPSPYGEGQALFFIVARGPSDAIRASERVSPASVGVRGRERWRVRNRDQEVSPPGMHRDREVSPTGENGIVRGVTNAVKKTWADRKSAITVEKTKWCCCFAGFFTGFANFFQPFLNFFVK